jgi:hypothetical protein
MQNRSSFIKYLIIGLSLSILPLLINFLNHKYNLIEKFSSTNELLEEENYVEELLHIETETELNEVIEDKFEVLIILIFH